MNFNCYNYNELLLYLSQMIHGYDDILYLPYISGDWYLLGFRHTNHPGNLYLSFSRKGKHNLRLLIYNVYKDESNNIIHSPLDSHDSYQFRLR